MIRPILATIVFFTFGSFLAWADTSHLSNGHDQESQTVQQKLLILESKINALESRIDQHLPKPSIGVKLGSNPYDPETSKTMVGWSSKDHLTKARVHHQQFEALESKIHSLNDRIDRLNRKPYLDSKGLKRNSLKRIKGNLVRNFRDAALKTAWHQEQAQKLMLSESAHKKQEQNS